MSRAGQGRADLEPGLLLKDVLPDVLHFQKQGLALSLYQLRPSHLAGSLTRLLSPYGLILPCLHKQMHNASAIRG